MTTLKMVAHSVTGTQMVEIFDERGKLVGCIYPHANGIHVVSRHFADDALMPSFGMLPIPGYIVSFKHKGDT